MATQYQLPESPLVALAPPEPTRKRQYYLLVFLFLLEILLVIHLRVLALPFFWDEHGQFIPTALDLLRSGSWIAHSTTPNVHPPGVEAYLVVWYKLLGFSIPVTRVAMLLLAALGLACHVLIDTRSEPREIRGNSRLPCLSVSARISTLLYTEHDGGARYAGDAIHAACRLLVLEKKLCSSGSNQHRAWFWSKRPG